MRPGRAHRPCAFPRPEDTRPPLCGVSLAKKFAKALWARQAYDRAGKGHRASWISGVHRISGVRECRPPQTNPHQFWPSTPKWSRRSVLMNSTLASATTPGWLRLVVSPR